MVERKIFRRELRARPMVAQNKPPELREGFVDEDCTDAHAPRAFAKHPSVSDATFERAAAIFRAAGDVARLRLLQRLADGEWCVSELAAAAEVGMSTVSQQLRLLRSERIVTRRRAGKHIYYRLTDTHIVELLQCALAHAEEPDDESDL
jgi:ArsR family transcriptional regulator, lead/cadmium/zinc/bismuth-responsive transcriptional repressor